MVDKPPTKPTTGLGRVLRLLATAAALMAAAVVGTAIWFGLRFYVPDTPRAVLEKRYARPATRYVAAVGLRLRVSDAGPRDGPVVIMLHGYGSSLETWHYWEQPLAKRYRVIRYDLPGFGLTGPDPSRIYNDERDITVLAALMDRLGVRRATIIGSSSGGEVAWKFAAERPDRVDRLVLVSPDGFADPNVYGKKPQLPDLIELFRFMSPELVLKPAMSNAYNDPHKLKDSTYARAKDLILAPGVRQAMIDRLRQNVLVDPLPILARIRAPTLVMWGDKDTLEPPANAPLFEKAIPGAKLVMLPGIGHIPFREDPKGSLIPLQAFLDSDEEPSPRP